MNLHSAKNPEDGYSMFLLNIAKTQKNMFIFVQVE